MREQNMSEYRLRMTELHCDFCKAPDPPWAFPVDDFSQELVANDGKVLEWASTGGWSACETCKELVENNRRKDLAQRSFDSALDMVGLINEQQRTLITGRLEVLHDEFFAMLNSPAVEGKSMNDEAGIIVFKDNRNG
jgi:hypothetical protein